MDELTPVERSRQRHIVLEALRDPLDRDTSIRAWRALVLSPRLEVWSQLLQGEPVPEDQLDRKQLGRARARRL